ARFADQSGRKSGVFSLFKSTGIFARRHCKMCLCPTKPSWFIPAKNLLAPLREESSNLIIPGVGEENSRNSNFNEPPNYENRTTFRQGESSRNPLESFQKQQEYKLYCW